MNLASEPTSATLDGWITEIKSTLWHDYDLLLGILLVLVLPSVIGIIFSIMKLRKNIKSVLHWVVLGFSIAILLGVYLFLYAAYFVWV